MDKRDDEREERTKELCRRARLLERAAAQALGRLVKSRTRLDMHKIVEETIASRRAKRDAGASWEETDLLAERRAERLMGQALDLCWRVVVLHLRQAEHEARKWGRRHNSYREEMTHATDGLLAAAKRYDPERGILFRTHARYWIKASLVRNVSRSELSSGMTERLRLIAKVEKDGITDPDEICRRVGINRLQLKNARKWARRAVLVSLETPITGTGGGSESTLGDTVAADSGEEEYDAIDASKARAAMESVLDERQRRIVELRFDFAETGTPVTLSDIGRELGLCRERIRQIEKEAIKRLREAITGEEFQPVC